jgi:hypothetical protein
MSHDPSSGGSGQDRDAGAQQPPSYESGHGRAPGYGQAAPGGYGPPQGYGQGEYGQGGYPEAGYPQAGYPQPGYPQPGYPQPGYPQQGPYGGPPVGGPQGEARGFFSALFDFSFTTFATPVVVKVVYIVGIIVLALGWVGAVVVGFSRSPAVGLAALLLGGLAAFFYLVLLRVTLELYYAIVRMSEDVHRRP